jgi:hypothetical protein
MGLKIMRYRANMLGEVLIERRQEGGTRVILSCRQPAPSDNVGMQSGEASLPAGEDAT